MSEFLFAANFCIEILVNSSRVKVFAAESPCSLSRLSPSPFALPTHASADGVRSGGGPFHFRHRRADARAAGYKKTRGRERLGRAKAAAGTQAWEMESSGLADSFAYEYQVLDYLPNKTNNCKAQPTDCQMTSINSCPFRQIPLFCRTLSAATQLRASKPTTATVSLIRRIRSARCRLLSCPSVRPSEALEIPSRAASR